jgi:hypothetical protein
MSKDLEELYQDQLQDYLKSQRQWTRQCRIDHARLQLSQAASADKRFYIDVLAAYGAEVSDG